MSTTNATPQPEPLLFSARDAARMLGVSERNLWSLTANGKLQRIKLGRLVRYSLDDLRKFIDQQREPKL